jgi:hypothetical protein
VSTNSEEVQGPLQADCIRTIVSCIWRKRRVRDKRRFDTEAALERVENNVLCQHPPPLLDTDEDMTIYRLKNRSSEPLPRPRDDYQQLLRFSSVAIARYHLRRRHVPGCRCNAHKELK